MAASVFSMPFRPAFDANAASIPGAQIWFTLEGTDTPSAPFADIALTTPLANPVVANSVGRFPAIYYDDAISYRVRVYDEDAEIGVDTPLEEYDPYGPTADLNLRGELAETGGSALIGTAYGKTLAGMMAATAIRPTRGNKPFYNDRLRAVDAAIALSNPATSPIWGFARLASTGYPNGVTGGYGYTEVQTYDPEGDGVPDPHTVPFVRFVTNGSDDVNVEGSLLWALAQIRANGGGYVIVHPRGKITTNLTSGAYIPNNCTFAAPGRNYTIKQALNGGGIRFYGPGAAAEYGRNIIMWGVEVLVEGGGETANYDIRPGERDALAAVPSYGSNKIAVYECTVSGATDGFWDISGGERITTPVYMSLLRTVVRNTDKTMSIGTGGTAGSFADAPMVFVTVGRNHFDGCSQRKPLASTLSYVHWHGNVDDSVPHYRDYSEGTSIGSYGCGDARNYARVRFEGNIARLGTSTALQVGVHQGFANNATTPGAAVFIDNYFAPEVYSGTAGFNESYVGALPSGYTYPTLDVLTDTEAAADQIIAEAGAGRTNWPHGLYVPVSEEDATPLALRANGEQVVYQQGGPFWVRVEEQEELQEETGGLDPLALSRGGTLTIAAGAITLLDSRIFQINGEGSVADDLLTINLTTDDAYSPITGGLIWVRGAAGAPITVKSGGNINTTRPIILDNATKYLCLFWNGTSWDVVSAPETGGTYTPALTATLNCSALSLVSARWNMSHSSVKVRIAINGTATAAGRVRVGVTLPKAAPNLATGDLIGTASAYLGNGPAYADTVGKAATLEFNATAGGTFALFATFEYEIN